MKDDQEFNFYGQQEGERILYVVVPHYTRRIVGALFAAFSLLFFLTILYFFHTKTPYEPEYVLTFGIILALIFFTVSIWWVWVSADRSRTIITDRRFIRMEAAFPCFITKRSLFWEDVAKAKGFAPNILFRFMRVGSISLQPTIAPIAEVGVSYVYYFEDLANYIDKIIYTSKKQPEELANLRPFVLKRAGERY